MPTKTQKFQVKTTDLHSLQEIMGKGRHQTRTILRAWILHQSHQGKVGSTITRQIRVSLRTVYRIRAKYRFGGLKTALHDQPRPGRKKKVNDQMITELSALACSNPPKGYIRWTLALLHQKGTLQFGWAISQTTIWRILSTHKIKPWIKQMWCIAEITTQYLERMYDILEIYARLCNPQRPVFCIDEKNFQLTSSVREPIPMTVEHSLREDYEYTKKQTLNLFVLVEPLAGFRIVQIANRRRGLEFALTLLILVEHHPNCEKIIIVVDNLNTHYPKFIEEYLPADKAQIVLNKIEWHYTPKHASWLNMAENEIGSIEKQCLKRKFDSETAVFEALQAYVEERNSRSVRITWTYTVSKAQKKFPQLAKIHEQRILTSSGGKISDNSMTPSEKNVFQPKANVTPNDKRKTPLNTELRDKLKEYEILKAKTIEREGQQRPKKTRKKFNQRESSKPVSPIPPKEKKILESKKRKTRIQTVDPRFKNSKIQTQNLIAKKEITSPFRDQKQLKLTWAARRILEFLKLMSSTPQSLKAIKSATKMHKILIANSITRLISLKLIKAKKVYNQEKKCYESGYLITNSASGKGPPE